MSAYFLASIIFLSGVFSSSEPITLKNDAKEPQIAQNMMSRKTSIRITAVRNANSAPINQLRTWKENGAPKCYSINSVAGVVINQRDSIDLVMKNGTFARAKLEKGCAAIEFTSGLYINPTKDGRMCEDRDSIHSRNGATCEISKFKSLSPD
jgi:hypothetical protein